MLNWTVALVLVACPGDETDDSGTTTDSTTDTTVAGSLADPVTGDPGLASIQNLDFAPDGTLAITDGDANQVVALVLSGEDAGAMPDIDDIYALAAEAFGLGSGMDVEIWDVAANPQTQRVYVAAENRTTGDPGLFAVQDDGTLEQVDLTNVTYSAVAYSEVGEAGSLPMGMEWAGDYLVASVTEWEFAPSQVITIEVPVAHEATPAESTTNIYHRSHGSWENYAPMASLAAYEEGGETLLAATYTCTPTVRFAPGDFWKGEIDTEGATPYDYGGGKQVMDMVITSDAVYSSIHGFMPGNSDPWQAFGALKVERDLMSEAAVNEDGAIVMGGGGTTTHPSASRAETLDGIYKMDLVDDDTIVAVQNAGLYLIEAP